MAHGNEILEDNKNCIQCDCDLKELGIDDFICANCYRDYVIRSYQE